MKRIRRILLASDFSTASSRAFQTAIAMAKANRAGLTIVHVIAPFMPVVPSQYLDVDTWDRATAQARQWGRRQLVKLAARARTSGVSSATILREGDPSDQIVRTARSARADLVVIGTHGRRGISRLLLGSVAERVVGTAPCPVVTVRGRRSR